MSTRSRGDSMKIGQEPAKRLVRLLFESSVDYVIGQCAMAVVGQNFEWDYSITR